MSPPRDYEQPSERSPLLGQQNGPANGHVVDPEDQSNTNVQTDGADEVVLAEEPSTRKLVLTMVAIWLGVFFAALGKPISPRRRSYLIVCRHKYCRNVNRSHLIRLQLPVATVLASHWLPRRQLRLPAIVRQAYRYLRAQIRPTLQQLLLRCRNPHLRPRTQCAHNYRWQSDCWHWRRRLDLHHHLRHLRSRPIAETRSLAGLRQRCVRHGNGSRRNCGWRLRRQRLLALGFPVPGALHRCLYHHGLVPDRHPHQPEQETTTSTY